MTPSISKPSLSPSPSPPRPPPGGQFKGGHFHLFPELPTEIRIQIIEEAVLSSYRLTFKTLATCPFTFRSNHVCVPSMVTCEPETLQPPHELNWLRQVSRETRDIVDHFLAHKLSCDMYDPKYNCFSWCYRGGAATKLLAEKGVRLPLPSMHPDNTIYYIPDERIIGWRMRYSLGYHMPPLLPMRWVRYALVNLDTLRGPNRHHLDEDENPRPPPLLSVLPNLRRLYVYKSRPVLPIVEGDFDEVFVDPDSPKNNSGDRGSYIPPFPDHLDIYGAIKKAGIEIVIGGLDETRLVKKQWSTYCFR